MSSFSVENNRMEIFENTALGKVRVVVISDNIWFVAKDVCDILDYTNSRKALIDHCFEDDVTNSYTIKDSLGREQSTNLINESGLYALVFGSKMEKAKQFKKWVTSEVLPSLRKTGKYEITKSTPSYQIEDPIARAERWIEEHKELQKAQAESKLLEKEVNKTNETNIGLFKMKATESKTTLLALKQDVGRTINYFVFKHFPAKTYQQSHMLARKQYFEVTGEKYEGAKLSPLVKKESYYNWLSSLDTITDSFLAKA